MTSGQGERAGSGPAGRRWSPWWLAAVLAAVAALGGGWGCGENAGAARPGDGEPAPSAPAGPFLVVLGVAQDGGVPQAGSDADPAWIDPAQRRQVVSLGLVDGRTGARYLFEATPDLREQLHRLAALAPRRPERPVLDGVFLTHAHMGHYTGLMFLGHESLGAREVPVWALPRMRSYLANNGPWDQLVRYRNIVLQNLEAGVAVSIGEELTVTALPVPHRQEYSEVAGFRIDGPRRSVLFIPDIDAWQQWETDGTRIEDLVAEVDVAFLDGTFWDHGEIPGRDMSTFPHPLITESLRRFSSMPVADRRKIRFIHFNHTNPVLRRDGAERRVVEQTGAGIAVEGAVIEL